MSEKSKHIDYLIARVIAGEASEAQRKELEHWMEQNEANQKYFEGIRFAEQNAIASHRVVRVDVDKAWQKLHKQMRDSVPDPKTARSAKVLYIPIWLRIAAMVVLVSGLSLLLYRQINDPLDLSYETLAVADDENATSYSLADHSAITINRNSQIAYASDYGKKERRVSLAGEAFFSVKPMPEKPFIVESNGVFIKVTGTSFNIKAYESDSLVEVYVKTGSVLFFTAQNDGVSLQTGEMGIFNKNTGLFIKTTPSDQNITAYTNRVLVFYNTTLNEVFRQLKRVYNADIVLANPQIGLCTITVSFDDDEIDTVLQIIAETLDLKVKKENRQYLIEGEGCNSNQNMP